jgi:sporulation protein YlmC with PRC-barrel domain
MRLSELLDSDVVTESDEHLGHVRDVRLVRDGPSLDGFGRAYRVHELLVGTGSLGARLGLDHGHMSSPWILRVLFGRRRPRRIPWSRVISIGEGRVRIRSETHGSRGARY